MAGKKLTLPQQFYERLSVIIFQETDQLVKHQMRQSCTAPQLGRVYILLLVCRTKICCRKNNNKTAY